MCCMITGNLGRKISPLKLPGTCVLLFRHKILCTNIVAVLLNRCSRRENHGGKLGCVRDTRTDCKIKICWPFTEMSCCI